MKKTKAEKTKELYKLHLRIPDGTKRPRGCYWFEDENDPKTVVQLLSSSSDEEALKFFQRRLEPIGCELLAIFKRFERATGSPSKASHT